MKTKRICSTWLASSLSLSGLRVFVAAFALTAACTSPLPPSPVLAGTWSENFSVVGASLVVSIDGTGTGDGTYAIEAGRSGAVHVAGRVTSSAITLTFHYDYGAVRTFAGTLSDANHLTGTFDDGSATVTFTRR